MPQLASQAPDATVTLSDGSTTALRRLREGAVLVLVFLRHFG
jgi:hypothetical protein